MPGSFQGAVPKSLGHPVRPYLFLPPRTSGCLGGAGDRTEASIGWLVWVRGLPDLVVFRALALWLVVVLLMVSRMMPCLRASWQQQDFVRCPSEYSAKARSQPYSSAKPSQGLPSRFGFRLYKCLWE